MKKLIVLLMAALLLLTGCGKNEEENNEVVNAKVTIIEGAKEVDMSGYHNMSDYNHNFKAITTDEMIKLISEKGSGIVYLGSTGCGACQVAVSLLNSANGEYNVPIYYVDVYDEDSNFANLLGEVMGVLDEILLYYEGEKVIQTPHVFSVIDGEFKDSIVGLNETYDDSDAEKELMINRYKELIEPFK